MSRRPAGGGVPIEGSKALVTGASRGLGKTLVEALLERGAASVYAAARDVSRVPTSRDVIPVQLDITDQAQIDDAVERCGDIDLLINNAGVMYERPLLSAPDTTAAHLEMATNFFGTLAMCRAFAPVLAANGGGALVNILSAVAWFANPGNGSYCASKSAAWSMTNAARIELRAQGTLVTGVFVGYIDTDMAAGVTLPKVSARVVAQEVIEGVSAGAEEVIVGERARAIKASLPNDLQEIYPRLQAAWDDEHGGD